MRVKAAPRRFFRLPRAVAATHAGRRLANARLADRALQVGPASGEVRWDPHDGAVELAYGLAEVP